MSLFVIHTLICIYNVHTYCTQTITRDYGVTWLPYREEFAIIQTDARSVHPCIYIYMCVYVCVCVFYVHPANTQRFQNITGKLR